MLPHYMASGSILHTITGVCVCVLDGFDIPGENYPLCGIILLFVCPRRIYVMLFSYHWTDLTSC